MHIWHHSPYYWTMRVSWSANDQWHDRWGDVVTQCSSSNIEWLPYPKLGDDECSMNVDTHHLMDDADCKMLLQSYFIQLQEYLAINTQPYRMMCSEHQHLMFAIIWLQRTMTIAVHTVNRIALYDWQYVLQSLLGVSLPSTPDFSWICSYFWKYLRNRFQKL